FSSRIVQLMEAIRPKGTGKNSRTNNPSVSIDEGQAAYRGSHRNTRIHARVHKPYGTPQAAAANDHRQGRRHTERAPTFTGRKITDGTGGGHREALGDDESRA